jgi:hypothetical protein
MPTAGIISHRAPSITPGGIAGKSPDDRKFYSTCHAREAKEHM